MKTRIISGAVAILLLIGILLLHATPIFGAAFSLIGCIMVYELFKAFKQENRIAFLILSVVFTVIMGMYPVYYNYIVLLLEYTAIIFVYIVISTVLLLKEHSKTDIGTHFAICGYTCLIALSIYSISSFERSFSGFGLECLIITFCGAWLADTGAYFAGTFFGKHKLCPEISPKKTVEGLLGGIISNALLMMLVGYIVSLIRTDVSVGYTRLAIAGVICAILGLIGDLLASLVKRSCGIKDFGKIMPGHGGALDRFDSVVFVAPFMGWFLSAFPVFEVVKEMA